ncbi:hypothetical protein BVJ53_10880 [Lacticaseibacillus chiayiensis]|uniref:Uncharacterized protein n=1 Tax=Lacticaseibacillus chiayiensis TaxID=2100821 RepID=A0A4Q1TQ19_9LACO|nr:hypothetical protein [Lacticaseibacillus chiayiensis]RXT20493.1 hypothetical protein BVJ53_10880 [Lacticaseibacillus chiayiensis]UYN57428.1 hypothetical protein OFW50_05005 [Lacticaseibacillus chiayiensis]
MHYELLNTVDLTSPVWPDIKKRIARDHATLLTLTAEPDYGKVLAKEGLKGINLVDLLTKRTYHPKEYRFFNKVRVPYSAKVDMNENGSISILHEGDSIGREFLFPDSRRAAQDIRYTNLDGSLDYIEEYAADGSVFSNIFYYNNEIQEIVFYDMQQRPVLRYYYYDNAINYITIEDPISHEVNTHYANLGEFIQDQMAKRVHPNDTVTFNYMGVELDSLVKTRSHNVLQLVENPFDDNHVLRGNLEAILKNDIPYVQEVRMPLAAFQKIGEANVPMNKIRIG